jgi:predicted MFS family arabinose efflux permease
VPMIEFGLFADRSFVGAIGVAFIVSFAMLGMFFFLALYMQNILGFSPLEAGVRFLPSTLMIVIVAPIAGRLTDRIGPRWLITVGLTIVAFALFELTLIDTGTGYADLWPAFVLMGVGIALTMSPMSTAAMNAVHQAKAGIASGLLSMMRMVGGTFGVAATGAIFQGAVGSRLGGLEPGQTGAASEAAARAFIDGLTESMRLTAAVALAGAVLACVLIRGGRQADEPEDAIGAAPEAAPAEHLAG